MKLHVKVVAVCVSFVLCSVSGLCGNLLDGSNEKKWTCVCSSVPIYHPASNCSSSCHCTPAGDGEERWTCLCSMQQMPLQSSVYEASCFNSCNCTSNLSDESSEKGYTHNRVIVIVLLLYVILTAIMFTVSAACYFSHRDRCHRQTKISSGRDTSWNSATKLISHRTVLLPDFHGSNPRTGCMWRASTMFGRRKQTLFTCILHFSYVELEIATNNFSKENLIGVGGSSNVYRGQLKDGKFVAVKRLKLAAESEIDSEFLTEIELISRLNHRHVVPLYGYCIEYRGKQIERLLVFEYMPNGNLRECLDQSKGKDTLDWGTRVKVALGVARGLEYLHEAAAPRILHCDIKSTNILLDEKYTAKITDLGMAKHLMAEDFMSCPNSPAQMLGTFGYFAPEYAIVGKASLKSDIFSFGVVILELITGRRPIHQTSNKGDESLVIWAAAKWCSSKLVVSELADPRLKGCFPEEEMQMIAHLARECLHWDPESRPSMSEVVQVLSAIASDRPNRRNLPASIFMGPPACNINRSSTSSSVLQGHRVLQAASLDKVEIGQVIPEKESVARFWLSSSADQGLGDKCRGSGNVLRDECMDELMLLTSGSWDSHPREDENVDLTEPRFESFVQLAPSSP